MRLTWKFLRLMLLLALPQAWTGCSGINTSQSVSPATFFLPGLMKNDAPTAPPNLTPVAASEIASAN